MVTRTLRNKKAWMRIIEIALSTILIFMFIMYIQQFQFAQESEPSDWDATLLKMYGEDALRTFDLKDENYNYRSDFKDYLMANNWQAIEDGLAMMLSDNVEFTIYVQNSTGIEYKGGVPVSEIPVKKEKVTIDYMIAGEYGARFYGSVYLVLWFAT